MITMRVCICMVTSCGEVKRVMHGNNGKGSDQVERVRVWGYKSEP